MARNSAAGARDSFATNQGLARTMSRPGYSRLLQAEPWMQRLVPVLIAIFLVVVGASAFLQMTGARDDVINDHKNDLEIVGALVASRLGELTQPLGSDGNAEEILGTLMPASTLGRGRRFYLLDSAGRILHATPPELRKPPYIEDVILDAQPLMTFAERAGVMTIKLADGGTALGTVRRIANRLQGNHTHVAVIHPMESVLGIWFARTKAIVTLFTTLFGVVAALGAAFYLQAARARQADQICGRMTDRIDTALSEARCGLWEWDIARGRFFWSDSMYELVGYQRTSALLGFGEINALVHPEDGDLFALADTMMTQGAHTAEHEFRMQHANGTWIWLRARLQLMRDVDAAYPRLIGVVIDVTEQKVLEEQSRKADIRLSDAINSISEAFVLWDNDNKLVLCNSKFRSLHGLPAEAVVRGAKYESIIPDAALHGDIQIAGERNELGGTRVYEAQLSDGRWLQVSERRTRDGGFVSVGTDITFHKDQEFKLMDSERRLLATVADLRKSRHSLQIKTVELAELADRYRDQTIAAESANRVKTNFLANMSHELRTPLNAIIGFSEIMEQKMFGELGSGKYDEYVSHIRQSGSGLLSIINDILEMSRIEAGKVHLDTANIQIANVVEAAIAQVQNEAAAKDISIRIQRPDNLSIHADERALRQSLVLLLQNAVKFTPEGGQCAIRVRRATSGVNIFVEDTGIGMSKESLARFGRPFEILNGMLINGNKGSGLGVAIAKSLIDLHGGGIRVRSYVGSGTIVMVHLPLAPAGFVDGSASPSAARPPSIH